MRAPWFALSIAFLAVPGCPLVECGTGFQSKGDGEGCVVERVGACADGQVRSISGECLEPFRDVNEAAPVDTEQFDTDTAVGGGGTGGGPTGDTGGPVF